MSNINYALLVHENVKYPVNYTIKQNGTKEYKQTLLLGSDLTENQIKQLYFSGHFEEKPTQDEIDFYLDIISKKRTLILQLGMHVKIINNSKYHIADAGKIKKVTSHLAIYEGKKTYGLDGDDGLWIADDFEFCVEYPNHILI